VEGVLSIGTIWIVFIVVGAGVALYVGRLNAKRRDELKKLARTHRLLYLPHAPGEGSGCVPSTGSSWLSSRSYWADQFAVFDSFGRGDNRRATNILHGTRNGVEFCAFDYRYSTGSGKNRSTHRFAVVLARVPLVFTPITIRPEGLWDRMKETIGVRDIQFESDDFNRTYHVRCEDEQFAFKLIHPKAIDFLMRTSKRHWQFSGPMIMLRKSGWLVASDVDLAMVEIDHFLSLVPPYLREEIGFAPSFQPLLRI
jgi:hypothetical protein